MFLSIMKFLLKGTVKKELKELTDDPEFKATEVAIEFHSKELDKQIKDFEKKYGKKPRVASRRKYPWKGGYI